MDAAESFGSEDGGSRASTKAHRQVNNTTNGNRRSPALENASARLEFSRRSKVMEIWTVTTLPFGAEMG